MLGRLKGEASRRLSRARHSLGKLSPLAVYFLTTTVFSFLVTLIAGSFYAFTHPGTLGSKGGVGGLLFSRSQLSLPPIKRAFPGKDKVTVLLLGIDQEPPQRSDTVMLMAFSTEEPVVKILSLPRDTRVYIPPTKGWAGGEDKLAHAYARGRVKLAKRTIENLLGIKIDYYVVVDFEGFAKAVDALGGVVLEVEKPMHYVDRSQGLVIDLEPGRQRLNGEKALEYARFRHDSLGDLGRMQRQQKLLFALFEQTLRGRNLTRLPKVASQLYRSVHTDLSLDQLNALARHFSQARENRVLLNRVEFGEPLEIDGISYQEISSEELARLRRWLYELSLPAPPEEKQGADNGPQPSDGEAKEEK